MSEQTERERLTDEELAQQVQYIEEDEQNMMSWQDRRILREAARRLRASADRGGDDLADLLELAAYGVEDPSGFIQGNDPGDVAARCRKMARRLRASADTPTEQGGDDG